MWSGLKNGELLRRAENEFDVFMTTDKNLRYQQNLAAIKLAVVVLPSNQVPMVAGLLSVIEQTLKTVKPGQYVEIPLPSP